MSARGFGFTLTYRPVGPELVDAPDERPLDRLPSCQYPASASEPEREQALLRECKSLEAQGYRIERVERWNVCARCQGAGQVATRSTRLATRRKACPACGGGGAERATESKLDISYQLG